MSEQNKKLIREYLGAVSGKPKPKSVVDRYVSDENMELKRHIEVFEAGFPEYELNIEDIIAEDDKVAVRFHFIGKHDGVFKEFPPSGNDVSMKGIIIYQIKNNMIVHHWLGADISSLIKQLQPENQEVLV